MLRPKSWDVLSLRCCSVGCRRNNPGMEVRGSTRHDDRKGFGNYRAERLDKLREFGGRRNRSNKIRSG